MLLRGAAFARLRALLAARGELSEWEARAAARAEAAAAAAGVDGGGDGAGLQAEHLYYSEAWQPLQQARADAAAASAESPFEAAAAAAAVRARPPEEDEGAAEGGSSGSGGSSTSSGGGGGDEDAEDTLWRVCSRIEHFSAQARVLRPAGAAPGAPPQLAPGAASEVARAHRAAMLDALVEAARARGAAGGLLPPAPPPDCEARVAARSPEHDGLVRRVRVRVPAGPELEALRALAASKGPRAFMAAFGGAGGDPFARTAEWDYFREAPAAWCRLVVDAPAPRARLAVKGHAAGSGAGGSSGSSAAAAAAAEASAETGIAVTGASGELLPVTAAPAPAAGAASEAVEREIDLGPGGAQRLLERLATALAGVPLAAARAADDEAAVGARRTVTVERVNGGGSGSGSGSGAGIEGAAAPRSGLRVTVADADGGSGARETLELSPAQAASLVVALDDVTAQLPGSFQLRHPEVVLTPPGPLARAAGDVAGALAAGARVLLTGALLALPLAAIALPGHRAGHGGGSALAALAAAGAIADVQQQPAGRAGLQQHQQPPQPQQHPCTHRLSKKELSRLCESVEARVRGAVWLPLPEDDAAAWRAAQEQEAAQQQEAQQQQDASAATASPAASSLAQEQQQQQQQEDAETWVAEALQEEAASGQLSADRGGGARQKKQRRWLRWLTLGRWSGGAGAGRATQGLLAFDPSEEAALAAGAAALRGAAAADEQHPNHQQQQQQQRWRPRLRAVFQVVADPSTGAALGVVPVGGAAADAYARLPLVGELRGRGFAARQAKALAAFSDAARLEKLRRPPAPPPLAYEPAARRALPEGGPAVLRLELLPAPGSVVEVGKGKARALFVRMEPHVTAWHDADSVAAWEEAGALIGMAGGGDVDGGAEAANGKW